MVKNNYGFMLSELIISSTVVIATMVALYSGFNRVYSLYREKNNYYHVDGFYASKEMLQYMMKDDFNHYLNDTFENANYQYFIKDGVCVISNNICNGILNLYHVQNMVLLEYDKCILDSTRCNVTQSDSFSVKNATFQDYIDYVIGYYDIEESDSKYSYIVLTEIQKDKEVYYSNLRIR